jgi:hypothetical protein
MKKSFSWLVVAFVLLLWVSVASAGMETFTVTDNYGNMKTYTVTTFNGQVTNVNVMDLSPSINSPRMDEDYIPSRPRGGVNSFFRGVELGNRMKRQ